MQYVRWGMTRHCFGFLHDPVSRPLSMIHAAARPNALRNSIRNPIQEFFNDPFAPTSSSLSISLRFWSREDINFTVAFSSRCQCRIHFGCLFRARFLARLSSTSKFTSWTIFENTPIPFIELKITRFPFQEFWKDICPNLFSSSDKTALKHFSARVFSNKNKTSRFRDYDMSINDIVQKQIGIFLYLLK